MNINFRELREEDVFDFNLIAKWDNQDEIKYMIRPNFNEGEIDEIRGADLLLSFRANPDKYVYIIQDGEEKIGYVSIESKFNRLYKKLDNSSWISICVGDNRYRGKGVGKIAMAFLEEKSRQLKNNRIELGVFEYNTNARAFYKKTGYVEIGENKEFIYYDGKWQSDIRMEKYI
ncbi:MAG: GNAT family N-acetyltransferase [Peptostreptococcaceae bacterium]